MGNTAPSTITINSESIGLPPSRTTGALAKGNDAGKGRRGLPIPLSENGSRQSGHRVGPGFDDRENRIVAVGGDADLVPGEGHVVGLPGWVVTPQSDRVKWVMSWRIILHSTDMEINTNDFRRFGAAAIAPGLTNGIEFYFNQAGRRTDVFLENVKSIGQFLDYADGFTNLVNAVTSQSDYLSLDFSFDQPVVLAPGSNDQIVLGVSDDLTALDFAQVIVRGWQEFL